VWIVLPLSTTSPSAPESAGSSSALTLEQAERFAPSVTLSGKLTRPRFWLAAWKKKPWLRHLSGLTCEPSTAALGVASWIASLAATRANRSATPAADLDQTILATFGPRSLASLRKLSPASCSSRTSLATFLWGSPTSDESSKVWALELQRDCLRRLKSARRTRGSGCSSSESARAEDAESSGKRHGRGVSDTLTAATGDWSTCSTPMAHDARREGGSSTTTNGASLDRDARTWPTPGANDHKGSAEMGQRRGQLDEATEHWQPQQAESHCSLPAPATSTDGGGSSSTGPTSRPRLNPAFVEWLMGWPGGWTDFAPAATELSLWRRRMRSSLSGLVCGRKANEA
jgi:hypothetical protein